MIPWLLAAGLILVSYYLRAPRRRLGLISGPGLEVRPAVRRTAVREDLRTIEKPARKAWRERRLALPRASATPCELWERRRPR